MYEERKKRDLRQSRFLKREATSGFEPLVQLLQSRALPLGDVAVPHSIQERERETGIEPATFSLARRCSTTEPLPHHMKAIFHLHDLRYHTHANLSTAF